MNDKKDLQRLFEEQIPRASDEELKKKAAAHRRTLEQLRGEIRELEAALETRRANPGPPPWPGAVEPLVLAAVFLAGEDADLDSISDEVEDLSSRPYPLAIIRFTTHRLVQRGLLTESDRCFTITPQGERELAQARDDAQRWTDALRAWRGPSADGS